jgi:hypothetical protein
MARTVYSLRITAGGGLIASTGKVGPIVPDGLVYVVRDIDVVETSGTRPVALEVYGQAEQLLWYVPLNTASDPASQRWRGRQVYNEGEQVALAATSGTWDFAVSGYQLTLP